jgi:hypothetical protein
VTVAGQPAGGLVTGHVTKIVPGIRAHTPPLSTNVPLSTNLVCFACEPVALPKFTVQAEVKFDPVTVRMNLPLAARFREHPVTPGAVAVHGGVTGTDALHLNVTWMPCWFPSVPAGHVVPAGSVVRFWLVPLGPLTKIRNV